jgi:hypothetical protein
MRADLLVDVLRGRGVYPRSLIGNQKAGAYGERTYGDIPLPFAWGLHRDSPRAPFPICHRGRYLATVEHQEGFEGAIID